MVSLLFRRSIQIESLHRTSEVRGLFSRRPQRA